MLKIKADLTSCGLQTEYSPRLLILVCEFETWFSRISLIIYIITEVCLSYILSSFQIKSLDDEYSYEIQNSRCIFEISKAEMCNVASFLIIAVF